MLRAKNEKFLAQELFVLLILIFLPFKLFSVKFGIIISASRIATAACLVFLALIAIRSVQGSVSLTCNCRSLFKLWFLLIIYLTFSYVAGCFYYAGDIDFNRLHIMSLRLVEHLFIIPLCFLVLARNMVHQRRLILITSYWWRLGAIIAVAQSFVSLFGIFISYESIGEPSPENKARGYGFLIMRASSFFGEPRDLAGLVIPIFLLYAIVRQKTLSAKEWFLSIFIGFLTFSSTFFLSLAGLFIGFIASRVSIRKTPFLFSLALFAIVFWYSGWGLQILYFILAPIPRFELVLDLLADPGLILSGTAIGGDYAEQVSDLAMWHYIFSGNAFSWAGVFGHGLGSSQIVLRDYAGDVFGYYNSDIVFGSRFLIFIMLLELGFVGCAIIFFPLMIWINNLARHRADARRFKFYSYGAIMSSLFHDGYFFVILCIALLVMEKEYRSNLRDRGSRGRRCQRAVRKY